MSRTKGSGWGAGPLLYQICPVCGRKKAIYDPIFNTLAHTPFKCTYHLCRQRSDSDTLLNKRHP